MEYDILTKTDKMQSLKVSLQAGDVIPLHDHPKTQVFMFVLSGLLKVDFYRYQDSNCKVIIHESSKMMGPGHHELITDSDINLHHIEAIEDSEFLDVMTPGYFEDQSIAPTWLEPTMVDGVIEVRTVPQPKDVTEAKDRAVKALSSAS